MKKKILIIAILAMSIFAVQGYAQGSRSYGRGYEHGSSSRGSYTQRQGGSSRSHHTAPPQGGSSRSHHTAQPQGGSSRGHYTAPPQGGSNRGHYSAPPQGGSSRSHHTAPSQRGGGRGNHVAPSRHDGHHHHHHWRPTYHHHHGYIHHHHHCIFDSWNWYTWGGYSNRFIRHSLYHNRYFDSMLGYYLWDSFDAPSRIDIGVMSFIRSYKQLKIVMGSNVSYLNLYQYHKVTYQVGNTYVQVITDGGYATLYFYDEYGNSATYRL